jgi:hypothetical protein
MDGKESKLAKKVFSIESNKEIWNNVMKNDSFYGVGLDIDGKKKIVTDGDISKYVHKVFKEVENLIQEYSKK